MEARRLRKRVCGIPVEIPPEWLPDGWTVEVRNTRHDNYRYYRSPASGRTFRSKEEVFRHLSVIKHDDGTSGRASSSNESKKQLAEERKESVDWLPSGWILEIKTRRSGKSAGKSYKCYFEPLSGDRFYSKGEVLRFLSSKKVHERASEEKKHLNRNSTDNAIARIEYSRDCSPHGWAKESKFKEGNGGLSTNLSPDSTEKRKSRPCEESVEAKPEGENASESAILTPPCPHNTRERTPKNGRIPAKKCTRRSIISIEKADMESEENIKPEKVTEDEASKGREDEPESATKSMENSKEEDEAMPRATDEFPLASTDELKLVNERVKFFDPQNKNLSEMEKELPAAAGNPYPSTPDLAKPKHGSRKTKAMNAISRPRRLSTRLASVEIDPATDVDMGGERPHGSKCKNAATDLLGKPPRRENGEAGAANTAVSLQRPNTVEGGGTATAVMNRATIDWADFSSPSPFGDSWSDPCLEFAFKTLTGDLPVLDDAMAIQEYFQQNLYLVDGSTSPDVLDPISNNKIDAAAAAAASDEAEIKLASEQEMKGRCQLGVMEKK